MDESNKITKSLTLTLKQWQVLASALDFYLKAHDEFADYSDCKEYRNKYIQPVYDQMPEEAF